MSRFPQIAVVLRLLFCLLAVSFVQVGTATAQTLYSIGELTDMEQVYVELINRARANPNAEAQRLKNTTDSDVLSAYSYFGVNLTMMVSQFATIAATPPLAPNAKLIAAARLHSQDMLANAYQGHTGTDGSQPWDRGTAQGYNWSLFGENVYASATSVFYGHAGFEVDWGGTAGTGGMQSPAGHRENIHNANYREIGVGMSLGTNGTVGPQIVTQDFGSQISTTPFITGVVYYDFNGNGFYDVGEGIGGVTVGVAGSSYYAVTGVAGSYTVPVPGNGNYTATFSAPGMVSSQQTVAIAGGTNAKIDYTPGYTAPTITGPDTLSPGQSGVFAFSAVGAANGYDLGTSTLAAFSLVEGAESGTANVTATVSPGYSVVESDTVKNGAYAFHLAHPQAANQALQLNHTLRIATNSVLTFWSRLGWASSGEIAAAQVSVDGGNQWQDVWAVAGTNGAGQSTFSQQAVSLGAFAGKDVMIRFLYRFVSGSYYPQTTAGNGFYVDDITVTNALELIGTTVTATGAGSFQFISPSTGTCSLAVRAKLPGRTLPWGPAKTVAVQGTPVPSAKAAMTTPADTSTLASGTVAFTWTAGTGVTQYLVWIGSTPQAYDIHAKLEGTSLSDTVPVPTDGRTLYVTLWSNINGTWQANAYTYTAFTNASGSLKAAMLSPASGVTFAAASTAFTWDVGKGVSQYLLWVGSTPQSYDVYAKLEGASLSDSVTLPTDGRTLYVTLWSSINGAWQANAYQYTAFTNTSGPVKAAMLSPSPGATLAATTVFTWNAGKGVTQYLLWVGSTPQSYDVHAKLEGVALSDTVALPRDGRTVYVTLWSLINGAWQASAYSYRAATN